MNKLHMLRAIQLSEENMLAGAGGPFGAVIVKDDNIIAEGWNEVTSANDPTAHAEVMAIRKASKAIKNFNLSGCVIYTSCEPCPMCLAAIYWARIEHIYFANTREDAAAINFDDEFLYNEVNLPLEKRSIPVSQCCHLEANAVFEKWKKKNDKTPY